MIKNLLLIISCLSSVIGLKVIAEVPNLTKANTKFALSLYQDLKSQPGNLFLSPYSISTALAMTYAGARGETAKEMAEVLNFPLEQSALHLAFAELQASLDAIEKKGQVKLSIANSLWPQIKYPILPEYLSLIKDNYGVTVKGLDYQNKTEASRLEINQWVEAKTENKIKDLIPKDLDPMTRLILVNAIYFKGNWLMPFNPEVTHSGDFFIEPQKLVQVPLMHLEDQFAYAEFSDLQILEMVYKGEDLSLLVLLPKDTAGITKLESQLTIENLANWQAKLKRQDVQVVFPKLKIEASFNLSKTLVDLGMPRAFSGKAEFEGIDGQVNSLSISKVLHQAFIEINETGTEAAAATAVMMAEGAAMLAPNPIPVFRADHPFVFAIKEKSSGAIIFLGRVNNPT